VAERLQVQHRYEEQVAILEEAVQKNPKDYYALNELGRAYLQLGDEERSYQTLQKAWKGGPIQPSHLQLARSLREASPEDL
jgi:tetratricopeptide (TPR) repeat protein